MQILIGCAKDMAVAPKTKVPYLSKPLFEKEAERNALQMSVYSTEDLMDMLGISKTLAMEVHARYQSFSDSAVPLHAAVVTYNGVVFRNIGLDRFTDDDFNFAQHHLWITSFLYGLLRPLDGIRPYRLEGGIELSTNGVTMFAYWRQLVTGMFIDSIRNDDGILIDLASKEMRQLFDWNAVEKSVKVIKPDFYVEKNGKLTMPSVNAKKCRGAMTSWIIRNRISDPGRLRDFTFNGLSYQEGTHSDSFSNPIFL